MHFHAFLPIESNEFFFGVIFCLNINPIYITFFKKKYFQHIKYTVVLLHLMQDNTVQKHFKNIFFQRSKYTRMLDVNILYI